MVSVGFVARSYVFFVLERKPFYELQATCHKLLKDSMLQEVTVKLLKPAKSQTVSYQGQLLLQEANHLLVHARWTHDSLHYDYVSYEWGDHFFEHYYLDKWFNIFEFRSPAGRLKGWYCNVTKPATLHGNVITSEDLELDLFVSADRRTVLTLDEEEFEARALGAETRAAALDALAELKRRVAEREPPFDSLTSLFSLGLENPVE